MTYQKPVTTIKVNAGGAELTLTIDGAADATAEDFASELFDLARIGFATAFTGSFQDQVLDQLEYAFEARLKDQAAESEYDMGYRLGHAAGLLGPGDVTSGVVSE